MRDVGTFSRLINLINNPIYSLAFEFDFYQTNVADRVYSWDANLKFFLDFVDNLRSRTVKFICHFDVIGRHWIFVND